MSIVPLCLLSVASINATSVGQCCSSIVAFGFDIFVVVVVVLFLLFLLRILQ